MELQGRSRQQQLSPGDDGHDRTMVVSGNVCCVVSTEFEWSGNCSSFRLGCLPNALRAYVRAAPECQDPTVSHCPGVRLKVARAHAHPESLQALPADIMECLELPDVGLAAVRPF